MPTTLPFAPHFNAPAGSGAGNTPQELGFNAWSSDPGLCVAGTAGGVAGTVQLRRLSIPGPMTIIAVMLDITTGGAALTANQCFAGVWDQQGNLIGLSNDQAGAFAGTGMIAAQLQAGPNTLGPPFVADTPYVYAGYWFNGTTGPFMARTSIVDAGAINGLVTVIPPAQYRAVTANTGRTTAATVPVALSALTASTNPFWVGLV